MLHEAKKRGFHPKCVLSDSRNSSIENLKLVRSLTWLWVTRLKSNRLVNPDETFNRPISEIEVPSAGGLVHHLRP